MSSQEEASKSIQLRSFLVECGSLAGRQSNHPSALEVTGLDHVVMKQEKLGLPGHAVHLKPNWDQDVGILLNLTERHFRQEANLCKGTGKPAALIHRLWPG